MSKLRVKVSTESPDVLAICETWLQADPLNRKYYPDECLQLDGYNMYRYDNSEEIRGGMKKGLSPN